MEHPQWRALYDMAATTLPQIKQDFVEWVLSTYVVDEGFVETADRGKLWRAYQNQGETRAV